MNLNLALDVSWRRITGPLSTVRLIDYGDDAAETAEALGMHVDGFVAHLSARTPDLAEEILSEAGKQNQTPKRQRHYKKKAKK